MPVYRILLVAVILLTSSCDDGSETSAYTIGIVNPVAMRDAVVRFFQEEMTDLGYVEDENVTYLYEGAIPAPGERAEWVQTLVDANVDLIVGIATPGAISAARGTDTIPVLFFPVTDPVGSGLVDSLNAPGGNVTGITNGNPHPLRLQLLLELDPSIEVVYAPYDADSPPALSTVPTILEVVDELGVEMIMPAVRTDEEIRRSLREVPDNVDAIFAMPDPRVADYWREWSQVAMERGIPFSSLSYTEVEGGVLMAYGEELDAVGRQAARMADVILQGTSPADMPVETADFFLSINLQTAERMGITVPEDLLQRATFVIYPDGHE